MEQETELTQEEMTENLQAGYDDAEDITVDQQQQEEADPWDGVPEAIRAKFGEMSEKLIALEKVEQRLRKSEGHIGDLIKKVTAVKKQEGPTPEQLAAQQKEKEEVESLRDLHGPELIDFLEKRNAKFAEQIAKPDDIAKIREELATDFDSKLNTVQQQFESRLVSTVHPGWTNTVKTPQFTEWMKTQGEDVIKLANSPRAEDAIRLLDTFTKRNDQEPRNTRLERAVTPKRTSASSRPLTLATMTPEQRRAYEIKQGYDDD